MKYFSTVISKHINNGHLNNKLHETNKRTLEYSNIIMMIIP